MNDLIIIDGKPLAVPPPQHEGFAALAKTANRLVDYVPSGADRVQLVAGVLAEANKKSLANCTRESVAKTAFNCIVLGLVPGDFLGMAHFVPFKNSKAGTSECQLVIGYKGWLELAYDGDFLLDVHCEVVLHGEEFSRWNDEGGPHILHKLALDRDEQLVWPNVEAAYCVWHSRGGGRGLELVGRKALDVLKRRGNVWDTNPIAMALKTPILRAAKTWRRTRRIAMASALDDALETETSQPTLCDAGINSEPDKPRLEAFVEAENRNSNPASTASAPSTVDTEAETIAQWKADLMAMDKIAELQAAVKLIPAELSAAGRHTIVNAIEMRIAEVQGVRGRRTTKAKEQLFDSQASATESGA